MDPRTIRSELDNDAAGFWDHAGKSLTCLLYVGLGLVALGGAHALAALCRARRPRQLVRDITHDPARRLREAGL